MSESLFLLRGNDALTKLSSAKFETEDIFQGLLARFPDLLTDADFGEGTARRWVLVSREAEIPTKEGGSAQFSLDHLFLDQDGVPTLVEVKRATDTRARREVVAQMLDYAANATNWWRIDDLVAWFGIACERDKVNRIDRLKSLLATDAPDEEAFWRRVQANLSSGRIRMIFVADVIAPELARIVAFLNEQMNPAVVVALELRPFASGSERILAPRLIGVTPRATDQKSITRSSSIASVEAWLLQSTAPDLVKRFLEDVESLGASYAVAGQSLAIIFGPASLRIMYVRLNGRVALGMWQFAKSEAFKTETARMELLRAVEGLGLILSSRNVNGEPTFSLPNTVDSESWVKLKEFLSKIFQRIAE